MKNPFASRDLSEATRRRVELAIAVAQERLLSTHVKYALELVEMTRGRRDFEAALDIYARVLRLDADDARVVSTQVLARLGEREVQSETPHPLGDVEAGGERSESRSFIGQLRERLRGRVEDELRRAVEFHGARAEVALLETHVDNALNFVDILQKDLSVMEALELYLEALEVRDSIAEVVYYISLDRLSDRFLPNASDSGERTLEESAPPAR